MRATAGLPLTFRVLGSTTEPMPQVPDAPLSIYGQYDDAELRATCSRAEKPDVLLFAAQVPETYAYTLSVALASGLPIVASALGALPERLAGHPRAWTVPWNCPGRRLERRAARRGWTGGGAAAGRRARIRARAASCVLMEPARYPRCTRPRCRRRSPRAPVP